MNCHGWIICLLVFGLSVSAAAQKPDDQRSAADRIGQAARKLNRQQTYQLEYRFKEGETIRWTVEHVASTKTAMGGIVEETASRSLSTKVWKVTGVDALGKITFIHSLESAKMWQKIGDADPVDYDSRLDQKIPDEYQSVADKLGKPLAVFTVSPQGEIISRNSKLRDAHFGTGDVTTPLPRQAISIGHRWHVPSTLQATDEDGKSRQLKARISYKLMKVKSGNAYISFRTEVLTPVESPKIKSQIMQQMTKGFLVFDIVNGRHVRKEIEWDETVQGYDGPDSFLQYLGKMTEKIVVPGSATASATKHAPLAPLNTKVADQPVPIKTRNGKPIIRK